MILFRKEFHSTKHDKIRKEINELPISIDKNKNENSNNCNKQETIEREKKLKKMKLDQDQITKIEYALFLQQ